MIPKHICPSIMLNCLQETSLAAHFFLPIRYIKKQLPVYLPAEFQSEHYFLLDCRPRGTPGQGACIEGKPSCRIQLCAPRRRREERMPGRPPGHRVASRRWFCR